MTGARKVQPNPARTRPHARLLQAILIQQHWTHQQLADEIGVTRATISRWLSDDREPSQVSMKVIRITYESCNAGYQNDHKNGSAAVD